MNRWCVEMSEQRAILVSLDFVAVTFESLSKCELRNYHRVLLVLAYTHHTGI